MTPPHQQHTSTGNRNTMQRTTALLSAAATVPPARATKSTKKYRICSGIVFMWAAEGFCYLPQPRCNSGVASWCQFRCCRCKLKAFAVLLALLLLSCRVFFVAVQPFAAIAEAVGAFYCFNIACRLRLTSPLLRLPLLLVLLLPGN